MFCPDFYFVDAPYSCVRFRLAVEELNAIMHESNWLCDPRIGRLAVQYSTVPSIKSMVTHTCYVGLPFTLVDDQVNLRVLVREISGVDVSTFQIWFFLPLVLLPEFYPLACSSFPSTIDSYILQYYWLSLLHTIGSREISFVNGS